MAGASVKWAHENIFRVTSSAFSSTSGRTTTRRLQVAGSVWRSWFRTWDELPQRGQPLGARGAASGLPDVPQQRGLPLEFRTQDFRPPTTLKTALAYYLLESEASSFIVNPAEFAAPRQLETTYSIGGEWAQVLVAAENGGGHHAGGARRVHVPAGRRGPGGQPERQ